MDSRHLWSGAFVALVVFGAYFVGFFQGQRNPMRWRVLLANTGRLVTRKGLAWSIALPILWMGVYAAFVVHVRLSLGRWPTFGESLPGSWLRGHHATVMIYLGALVGSLAVAAVVLVVCLFFKRWRHVSVYGLCYGVAVAAAYGSVFLAPAPFLNWLFD